jgi:pimeloyl-ACP methyl ester carboxylesterase
LNQLIPFLARTIIYDIHRFSEKKAKAALSEHERAILRDKDVIERTRDRLIERTARGMNGVIDEYKINAQLYDFDVGAIQAPITLFHGDCDVNNPLGGARMLAKDAQRARLQVLPGMGHHHIFYEWSWLLAAACGADFEAEMSAKLNEAALSDARAGAALPRG